MMSKAEEHPNILQHVAPFDPDKSYNPLQSFATYALSPNVFAVQCCRKKTSNNSSTSDKNSASFSEKELPRFFLGLVDQMTAMIFRQFYMTQRPSLFTLISYCAIVFSYALMFGNGWFTACDGFYGASACRVRHMKQ